jgi:hypothetical protein
MCTVHLRWRSSEQWALELGATRDVELARNWLPPAHHWPGEEFVGGLDLRAGGTWLAVAPARPALALLVDGPLEVRPAAPAPSRGELPLRVLRAGLDALPDLAGYIGFHLLLVSAGWAEMLSWDGVAARRRLVPSGSHTLSWGGLDDRAHPRVGHHWERLAALASLADNDAWPSWRRTFTTEPLPPDDPRALLIRRLEHGRAYGTTSAALLRLGAAANVRYEFADLTNLAAPVWSTVIGSVPDPVPGTGGEQ